MSEDLNLISTCLFRDKEYVLSLKLIASHTLDVKVTDKMTGEVWAGSYDCTYIENLTHKTGNFKQFDVFISMLRSGFLRTTDSITLDLLSYDDLEALRSLRKGTSSFYANAATNCSKRYLIVTYSVEFDRIHYPLPLDYCGPPNPLLLQSTIRKLEAEVTSLKNALERRQNEKGSGSMNFVIVGDLENRLKELTSENILLNEEIEELTAQISRLHLIKPSHSEMKRTIRIIEEQVERDRQNFQHQVKVLQSKNQQLLTQLATSQKSEACLQAQLRQMKVPGDVKSSPILANRRVRIRRNKYQLPPLPDRLPPRGKQMISSPLGNMIGDGINVRSERAMLSPRRPTGRPLSQRPRQSSISSASSVRSSSVESNGSRVKDKKRDNRKSRDRERDGMIKRKLAISSKCSDKSNKTNPKKSSINLRKSYHGSSDSIHTDRTTRSNISHHAGRNVTPKGIKKTCHKVSSNESKKSSSEIENRIRALQRLLKDKVHL